MRRNYITPEYFNNKVNGTFSMKEVSNFFSSKMIEIDDVIEIDDSDIVWYQKDNGEQINLSIESNTNPLFYSPSEDKFDNHRIILDPTQSDFKKNSNARWLMQIDTKNILTNFIFSNLKRYRTFEKITKKDTVFKNIDLAIHSYIRENILDRYKFSGITLYLKDVRIDNSDKLRFTNLWNPNLENKFIKNNLQKTFNGEGDILEVSFDQNDTSKFTFEYYYNLTFKKI